MHDIPPAQTGARRAIERYRALLNEQNLEFQEICVIIITGLGLAETASRWFIRESTVESPPR